MPQVPTGLGSSRAKGLRISVVPKCGSYVLKSSFGSSPRLLQTSQLFEESCLGCRLSATPSPSLNEIPSANFGYAACSQSLLYRPDPACPKSATTACMQSRERKARTSTERKEGSAFKILAFDRRDSAGGYSHPIHQHPCASWASDRFLVTRQSP